MRAPHDDCLSHAPTAASLHLFALWPSGYFLAQNDVHLFELVTGLFQVQKNIQEMISKIKKEIREAKEDKTTRQPRAGFPHSFKFSIVFSRTS